MPAPNDPSLGRLRVSATQGGTYVNVAYVRSFALTEGSEGGTTLRWLGGEAVKAGDPTLSLTFPIYWDRDDTTGQEVLRAAKRSGTAYWFQICPTGTTAGNKCEQFQGLVTEVSMDLDAEAEAVEGSITVSGTPSTLSTVTLA